MGVGETGLKWDVDGIIGKGQEKDASRIDVKMLLNNRIPGILPLQIRYIDNESFYYYQASDWISFEAVLQEKELDFFRSRRLFDGIYRACCSCEEYFLQEEHFVLDTSYIAWNPHKQESAVCYFPDYQVSFGEQIKALGEKLLPLINYQDKRCVAFLYGIYDLIAAEGYSLPQIGEYLKGYPEQEHPEAEGKTAHGSDILEKRGLPEKKRLPEVSLFSLQLLSKGSPAPEVIELGLEPVLVGRSSENQYAIPALQLSRCHARFEQEDGQVYLTDMNTVNGVFLNGKRLSEKHPVLCREGDKISLADITYCLKRREG